VSAAKPKAAPFRLDRGSVFRLCRMLHTYLSAFAFMALLLFSATGVLLNHPEWFENYQPAETRVSVQLSPAELAAAKAASDPSRALAAAVGGKTPLKGAFASGDRDGDHALIRLEGPKGASDLDVDLVSGHADVRLATASRLATLLDLHRGKNAGAAWRMVIDASAFLMIALSLIGFVLFFSLRFRLRTSLLLVIAGTAALVAVGLLLVS
jgi:uncharacterized protein